MSDAIVVAAVLITAGLLGAGVWMVAIGIGYHNGHADGHAKGHARGKAEGNAFGLQQGYKTGRVDGYAAAYAARPVLHHTPKGEVATTQHTTIDELRDAAPDLFDGPVA